MLLRYCALPEEGRNCGYSREDMPDQAFNTGALKSFYVIDQVPRIFRSGS